MTKGKLISEIYRCAVLYQQHLSGKNYMIIYNTSVIKGTISSAMVETIFSPRNFLHLTGVKTQIPAFQFLKICLAGKLKSSDFTVPLNGTHEQKLAVLPGLIELPKFCKMIGIFNGNGFCLKTSQIMGNIKGSMGFVVSEQNSAFYAPNTVLEGDIRERVVKPYRILAMLRKEIKTKKYSDICYLAKGISLNDISSFLKETGKYQ